MELRHHKQQKEKLQQQYDDSKKTKDKVQHNQQLEEENRDLQKELSCKDEESSSLKRVNQELLEQIKKLKETEPKNQGNQCRQFKLKRRTLTLKEG